jgi:hypothetical protein
MALLSEQGAPLSYQSKAPTNAPNKASTTGHAEPGTTAPGSAAERLDDAAAAAEPAEAVTEAITVAVTTYALGVDVVFDAVAEPDAPLRLVVEVVLDDPLGPAPAEVTMAREETTGMVVDTPAAELEMAPARLAKPTAEGLYL